MKSANVNMNINTLKKCYIQNNYSVNMKALLILTFIFSALSNDIIRRGIVDLLNGIPCSPSTPTIACMMDAKHCLVECFNSQIITGINHTMEILIDHKTLVWMKFQPAYGFVFNGFAWEKDDVFPRRIGNKLEVIPRPGFVWIISNEDKTSAYLFKTSGSMSIPTPTTATKEISSTPSTATSAPSTTIATTATSTTVATTVVTSTTPGTTDALTTETVTSTRTIATTSHTITTTAKWVWMLVGSVLVLILIGVGGLIWKCCKSTTGDREEEMN